MMEDERFGRKAGKALCMLWYVLLFLLPGCERRELTYYMESEVTITADWGYANLDYENNFGSTAVFYPTDGSTPRVVLMGDRCRETARLPVGTYDVVLFNRSFDDFGSVAFKGYEAFNSFEAYSLKVETRAEGETVDDRIIITSPPERIAADTIRNFCVTEDMLGNYDDGNTAAARSETACKLHFTPQEITRTLHVKVHIKGVKNIKSAMCTLSGVSASLFLCRKKAGDVTVAQRFDMGTPRIDEGSFTDGCMESTTNVFGFDENRTHGMKITALLVDGKTVVEQTLEQIKITSQKTKSGSADLYIEAEVPEVIPDVKPEGSSDSNFDADVEEWGDEINTEIPL
mgnify:CR=1 FL=1